MGTSWRKALFGALAASMASAATGAGEFAVVGAYGFDWMRPKAARCNRISAEDAARFKPCTFAASGAFGLDLPYHSCPRQRGGEVIVLATLATCREALEAMRAHAP